MSSINLKMDDSIVSEFKTTFCAFPLKAFYIFSTTLLKKNYSIMDMQIIINFMSRLKATDNIDIIHRQDGNLVSLRYEKNMELRGLDICRISFNYCCDFMSYKDPIFIYNIRVKETLNIDASNVLLKINITRARVFTKNIILYIIKFFERLHKIRAITLLTKDSEISYHYYGIPTLQKDINRYCTAKEIILSIIEKNEFSYIE